MTSDDFEEENIKAMNKIIRILSFKFFREHILSYVLSNSRLKNPILLFKYKF